MKKTRTFFHKKQRMQVGQDIMQAITHVVPVVILSAYCIGFMIFVIYSLELRGLSSANILTFLDVKDHLVLFGHGVLVFIIFAGPFWLFYAARKVRSKTVRYVAYAILWFTFSRIAALSFAAAYQLSNNLVIVAFLLAGLFWLACGFIILKNGGGIKFIFVLLIILIVSFFSPAVVRMSGYGHYYESFKFSSSVGANLIKYDEFKGVVRCNNVVCETTMPLYVVLKVRDYILVASKPFEAKHIGKVIPIARQEGVY